MHQAHVCSNAAVCSCCLQHLACSAVFERYERCLQQQLPVFFTSGNTTRERGEWSQSSSQILLELEDELALSLSPFSCSLPSVDRGNWGNMLYYNLLVFGHTLRFLAARHLPRPGRYTKVLLNWFGGEKRKIWVFLSSFSKYYCLCVPRILACFIPCIIQYAKFLIRRISNSINSLI